MRRAQTGISWPLALLVLALLLGAAWAWWTYAPETLPAALRAQRPSANTSPPLYKWRDERGQWNITDRPPPGRTYETVIVDPGTNVLPSGVPPAPQ